MVKTGGNKIKKHMWVSKDSSLSKAPRSSWYSRGYTCAVCARTENTHLSTHAVVMLRSEKICTFPLFFNLICAFWGHAAFVLTLDINPPLMEDTCWKVEFWIMFSKLSRARRASIDPRATGAALARHPRTATGPARPPPRWQRLSVTQSSVNRRVIAISTRCLKTPFSQLHAPIRLATSRIRTILDRLTSLPWELRAVSYLFCCLV